MEKINWKLIVRLGIIGSLIVLISSILMYLFYETLMSNYWMMTAAGIGVFLIILFILIWAGITYRKENGGYASFPVALVSIFIIAMLINISNNVFNYILPNYIDKEYPVKMAEIMKTTLAEKFEKFGMSDDEIEKNLSRFTAKEFCPNLQQTFMNILKGALIYFIVSLIIAAFVKRNSTDIIEARTRNES